MRKVYESMWTESKLKSLIVDTPGCHVLPDCDPSVQYRQVTRLFQAELSEYYSTQCIVQELNVQAS